MILPRSTVAAVQPYRSPLEGRRGLVRLDFNENTRGFPWAGQALSAEELASYPEYGAFLPALAAQFGLAPGNVLLTNGSGEGIFLAAFTFIEPGRDRALTSRPTFVQIPHFLRIVGAQLVEVPATKDWTFDLPALEGALEEGPKLAVFASPDNPTGDALEPDLLLQWCRRFPGTLFVLDEAYAEYAGRTALPLLDEVENLLVLRSFSKAWGMAGLRLGVVVGPETILRELSKVRSPYSVNAAAVATAGRLLARSGEVLAAARAVMEDKVRVLEAVGALGYRPVPGRANFFLLPVGPDAGPLTAFCRERGVLLRDRSEGGPDSGVIRITVGTPPENDRFLEGLRDFRSSRGLIFDLDDTLVDTSRSYDAVVGALVEEISGAPADPGALAALRAEGGYNDDWDAATELLRRRGRAVPRAEIERRGKALYLPRARERERLLVEPGVLRRLARRYRLFLLTGRTRDEYAPVWGATLDPLFERVVCRDDFPDLPAKPAPDMLAALTAEAGLAGGTYVGNSVDDMAAAAAAGLTGAGLATTLPAEALTRAGARFVLDGPGRIEEVFLP